MSLASEARLQVCEHLEVLELRRGVLLAQGVLLLQSPHPVDRARAGFSEHIDGIF